jgi:hypothetical protein
MIEDHILRERGLHGDEMGALQLQAKEAEEVNNNQKPSKRSKSE